jgi:4-amino-4-deoxy-L-arabinose transferase-like glycosyltransferase
MINLDSRAIAARPYGTPSPPRAWIAALLVVLAWFAAAGPALLDHPLDKTAKARAWSVARTMAEGGDWVVPTYNDEPRLKKPPLASWGQAGAMRALSNRALWVAGLASLVFGTLFALGPWLLGRALGRETAGFLGSLALCSTRAAMDHGASPEHDVAFAGLVALSWAFLARALSAGGRARDSALAGLAAGAALLVKGPFAVAFVGGTAVAVRVLARARTSADPAAPAVSGPRAPSIRWVPLLVGMLLPVAAWLALVSSRLGSVGGVFDELRRQALGEGGAHLKHGLTGWLYYFPAISKLALPWAVVGLAAGALVLASRRRRPAAERSRDLDFAWIALGVAFVTLTVTPAKQEHYALSALPPLFVLIGAAIEDALRRPGWRVLAPGIGAACGLALLAQRVLGTPAELPRTGGEVLLVQPFAFLVAGAVVGLTVLVALAVRSPRRILYDLLLAVLAAGAGTRIAAARDRATGDYRDAAAAVGAATWAQPVVGVAEGKDEEFDTLLAWADRPWERERSRDLPLLRARLAEGRPLLVLVPLPQEKLLEPVAGSLLRVRELSPPLPRSDRRRFALYRARLREPR